MLPTPPLTHTLTMFMDMPWSIQSMEFSRPEYWSGQPLPSSGDLPNPGIEPGSPALQGDSLPAEPPGKPKNTGMGSLSLLQQIFPTQESNPMQEMWVRSLGQEDSLEKEMATHSSTLAWEIPWTAEPGRLHSVGLQRVRQTH